MCFSPPLSIAVGATATVVAALLAYRGKPFRTYFLFLYFGLMEFLQLVQYSVADQCGNPLNQWLTRLAFAHVAFQPFAVNLYFLYGQKNPGREAASLVLKLCLVYAVMSLARTPLLPLAKLGDIVHKWIPDIPPSSMYGQGCHYLEPMCGTSLCSITGKAWGHISWSNPLLPATYFVPGAWGHFFLFFVPVLCVGDWGKRALMVITVLVGPVFSMVMSSKDMTTYQFEWSTIWCFFAAIQGGVALLAELSIFSSSFVPLEDGPTKAAAATAKGHAPQAGYRSHRTRDPHWRARLSAGAGRANKRD